MVVFLVLCRRSDPSTSAGLQQQPVLLWSFNPRATRDGETHRRAASTCITHVDVALWSTLAVFRNCKFGIQWIFPALTHDTNNGKNYKKKWNVNLVLNLCDFLLPVGTFGAEIPKSLTSSSESHEGNFQLVVQ